MLRQMQDGARHPVVIWRAEAAQARTARLH
jgi:hypothetical protein